MHEFEIFRPGTYRPLGGGIVTFTEADTRAIATAYDAAVHDAPLVVGHPKTDDPAYGWVERLSFADGILRAVPRDVDPAFSDLVATKRFKKISAAFFGPKSPGNPKPGSHYLKHVGFLGAAAPAVKGLKPVALEGDDEGVVVIELAEAPAGESELEELRRRLDVTERENETLKASLATKDTEFSEAVAGLTRRTEDENFVETLIGEGRFLPAFRDGMLAFLDTLDGTLTVEFGEGDELTRTNPREFLFAYMKAQPCLVEYREMAAGNDGDEGSDNTVDEVSAWVDEQRAKGRRVSYGDGVRHVTAHGPSQRS